MKVNYTASINNSFNEHLSRSPENVEINCNKIIQKENNQNSESLDYDENSPINYHEFMDEAKETAYKTIMSRMTSKSPASDFSDHINLNAEIS